LPLGRGKQVGLQVNARDDNIHAVRISDSPRATWWGNYNLFHTAKTPKYHLYELPEDMGFDQCKHSISLGFKHNIDKLFIHKLLEEGKSVPPEKADVFVIPELLAQHVGGMCRNHKTWHHRLREFLLASPWFQRYNGSDHLLIGDHFAFAKATASAIQLAAIPGRVIVGYFEAYHPEARLAHS
jgi:hypothetical protein